MPEEIKQKASCEHYFACALCGEEQSVSDLLKKRDEEWQDKIKKQLKEMESDRLFRSRSFDEIIEVLINSKY